MFTHVTDKITQN